MAYITATEYDFERFKKVVFTKDWENLSKTASVKKGAVGCITLSDRGFYSVIFAKGMEPLVKPNDVSRLACHGIPFGVFKETNSFYPDPDN